MRALEALNRATRSPADVKTGWIVSDSAGYRDAGASLLAVAPFPVAAPPLPCVLPPLPRWNPPVLASLASRAGGSLPRIIGGSASTLAVSRPARRFMALRPAWSLGRPRQPVSSQCFKRCRYLHHPLRLLPAGATVAGRDSHPLGNGALARRTTILSPGSDTMIDRCRRVVGERETTVNPAGKVVTQPPEPLSGSRKMRFVRNQVNFWRKIKRLPHRKDCG